MKFFARGIVSAHDVTFSLRLLQGMIPLLLANQQQAEASMCLKTAIAAYQVHGWKLKQELEQLSMQSWYDSGVNEKQLEPFLNSISHDALDYLHGPIKKVVVLVENIHKSGKGFQVFVNKSISLSVRIGVHKDKQKPQAGDYVELSVVSVDGNLEAVASSPAKPVDMEDVSYIEGKLKITQKGFGFVEDTFVSPVVIGNIKNESQVRAQRILSWDKSKSRYNWKAIKLIEM